MKTKNKRGAMELSMGTIVTIVLGVTLLIGGIVFITQIIDTSISVVDMTDTALRDEVNKMFSSEKELVIYPQSRMIEIKQEELDGVGIGIKNLQTGASADNTFFYEVFADDIEDCGISEEEAEDWIVTGRTGNNIQISTGDIAVDKILFRIPSGTPLCVAKFRVNVCTGDKCSEGGDAYKSDFFNVEVKAK